ncbi:MAG: DNA polymerase/3'-5' exonuclease PolX, partial [Chloroflexi bacterium]|nr:DNA polymerase/3'-5' exonuclease PolX [Chloroflexota bacterium]
DINALYSEGADLTELPDIGKTIAAKVEELINTGELDFYSRLTDEVPASLVQVLRINGVGPKKAKLFWEQLGITTVDELQVAAEAGKLQKLSGMGAKSEQKILDGIAAMARRTHRISIGVALPLALTILDELRALPQVLRGEIAGSLRRGRVTIGDVDLLVAAEDPAPIMEAFVSRPDVARVLGHGLAKSSVELLQGLQVDLRVIAPERYGTALSYFTGSQQHNIRLRELALKQGLSLNEHAFTPTTGSGGERWCATEAEVYETLGLPWIPPELREDRGEIEAARRGELPSLISLEDIRSDLHMHTTWSDGKLSIREMAEIARGHGLSHIVITDHSRSLGIANGLTIERLMAQQEEVRAVDAEMGPDFTVLHGTEMDIKADGTLDYPDDVLEKLDLVIASVHVSLDQSREQVTQRVLNAIRNPHVDIIGHPTSRLIPEREPTALDIDAMLAAALEHDTALEINANPRRLDLDESYARRAQEMGIKLSINTDAHDEKQQSLLHYGIGTARRGWITPQTVINTWPLETLNAWLHARGGE